MSLPEKASSPCLVKFLPTHCLTRPPVSFTVFPIPISLRAGVMLAFVASVRSSVRSSVQDLAYCEAPRGTSGFPTGSEVKTLPVMQEMHIWSLCRDDSLEKEMTVHSSILAWRIPWTEEPGGLQSMGLQSQTRTLPPKRGTSQRFPNWERHLLLILHSSDSNGLNITVWK